MITLVLEASRIPDGTKVRKVTGQQEYVLQRELKVYIPGDTRQIRTEGIVFLTSDRSINGYPDTTKFAIDLGEDEAIEMLEGMIND
jgi:hypothetical protein